MIPRIVRTASGIILVCSLSAAAAPLAPPAPQSYDVTVHYRIVAFQNERILQFDAMLKTLQSLGFRRDPNEEPPLDEAIDVKATLLHGTVPGPKARSLLQERHVQALFLLPAGQKLPEDANQPVRVAIDLAADLPPDRQRLLHTQTAEALGSLKFTQAVGYDHRGYTRLVGAMPAGQLPAALADLRQQPAGRSLPAPFAVVRAIRVVEAQPGWPLPAVRPAPPVVPQGQEKLSSDLREVVADAARANKPLRLEIILANVPGPGERGWERLLRVTAPGISLEGVLGTLVTATVRPSLTPAIAALPEVVALRLPRIAQEVPVVSGGDDAAARIAAGLERLHGKGYRGKGNRMAIIAGDFRGWQGLVGRSLPRGTRLVDLTRERNDNLQPDPEPAVPDPGQGTVFAKMAAAAAPEADLVLIRVDPAAPYMLQIVARAIAGEPAESLALEQRGQELNDERAALDHRRSELLDERREVFDDLREVEGAIKRREEYQKNQAAFDREAAEFSERVHRYLEHRNALLQLAGVRVVVSTLNWDTRQPGGGLNAVSRFLDDRPFPKSLWIQTEGGDRRQTWNGLYRDADGNGVMEFAGTDELLPESSWSPEQNFLVWQTGTGKPVVDLPAGAKIRVTLQWREAHDPALLRTGQDPYREPLTTIRLLVLRQLDPNGATRPSDDLEVVAQTDGAPRRLDQTLSSATYEVSVEWRVPAPGRYAIRVEGQLAESDRPAWLPTLPVLRRTGEVRPRITVETLEGSGHAIWRDFGGDAVSKDARPGK